MKSWKIEWKPLIISFIITFGVGGLSSLLTKGGLESMKMLEKPPLSPPDIVFSIVWPILFFLIAISAYLVSVSDRS